MPLLSALLLGAATNLDNLFLGFSLGVQQKRLSPASNWIIGLFSAAAACLFCCISTLCAWMGPAAAAAGALLLLLLGVLSMLPARTTAEPGCVTRQDTAILGATLAVNCIPAAFIAGLTGVHPLAAAASVGFLSVLAMRIGNLLGLRAASLPLRDALLRRIGGGIMLLLGLLQLSETLFFP